MKNEINNYSAKELYREVNKAIATVMTGGQKYKIGDRELTRADLKELRAFKKELALELQEDSGHLLDNTYVAVFTGR